MKKSFLNLNLLSIKPIIRMNIFFIISLPISLNVLINLLNGRYNFYLLKINIYDFISTLLLFIFLYLIGNNIKKIFNFDTVSFGIVVFLTSFYIIDLHTILIFNKLSFNTNFLVVSFMWTIFFLFKNNQFKTNLNLIISYIVLRTYNTFFNDKITTNTNIIGDVEAIFFKQSKNIYENSYFYSVINYVDEGYPQFSSYLQSLMYKISFNSELFNYKVPTSQIVFLLIVLFFLDLDISKANKSFLIYTYTLMIFNNQFYQFLFTTSLMSEGIVSYLIVVVLFEVFKMKEKHVDLKIIFLIIGILYFTKQFINSFTILFILFSFFNKHLRKYAVFGLYLPLIKEVNYYFNFNNITGGHHLSQINVLQTLVDLLTLNNLKFSNISIIFQKILMDKPYFLFLFLFFFSIIYFYKVHDFKKKIQINSYVFIILLNYLFVFALYISAWQNMELESPIRFFLTYFNLQFLTLGLVIEHIDEQKKSL